jgi:hypothetical protein
MALKLLLVAELKAPNYRALDHRGNLEKLKTFI